ncbi:MAG TPA: 23S rRNA (guanosine(2251)-2'-O)-methyltransferase RlmB [Smithella sp.]|nr:23S rRNA (guanosine(2251)-2'-O)-methyltransferase RlmB [Smithella sp.]MDM7986166.1 23S rRNA (guanosine(2251)-2'-O)-methyltransferase RlmB [Smithella sp.]HNY50917.1 23S rRNA (guanosine(2251)-2'-O)-methyltransferase RlmB [Smithella sp.]HOG90999.1 23S rRNA (guanosine(2251)-2'-O)-methyltransferase RlmB [Smithella sp.]HOU51179.1 23S rRNA (guanosine(2251)-2'-O)-methyltransferase RlmB [Smithella sp.]
MEVIYGINAIRDLLRLSKDGWEKIVIASGRSGPSVKEIIETARFQKIPLEYGERKALDKLSGTSEHQGIIAFYKSFVYADLDDVIKNRNQSFKSDLVLMLDSIMDPQNLGSIIRTAHCLGANGIVIPEDRAAQVTAAVYKSSAGSVGQIPVARVINLAQSLDYLKDKGFWVFGADVHGGSPLMNLDFNCSVVLVLGGEEKGIRPLVRKKCDFLVTIPMMRNFDSLNVSVAAGIIQYEILRQRDRINVT